MIALTKYDGRLVVVNIDQIKIIEETPDTVITFMNGDHVIVKESVDEVLSKVLRYKRTVFEAMGFVDDQRPEGGG